MHYAHRHGQLPVSDWADQDLLTKDEAQERLSTEITRTRKRLDQLRTGGADTASEVRLLVRRLDAMESIRSEYDADLHRA